MSLVADIVEIPDLRKHLDFNRVLMKVVPSLWNLVVSSKPLERGLNEVAEYDASDLGTNIVALTQKAIASSIHCDYLMNGKNRASCFRANLAKLTGFSKQFHATLCLQAQWQKLLSGFLTNCCVESTMRTAYEKGFNTITLTDCCATTTADGQKASTTGTFGMFSTPMTKDEFVKSL